MLQTLFGACIEILSSLAGVVRCVKAKIILLDLLYCVYLLLPFAIVVKGILSDFVVTWSTMTTKHILHSILYY